jgi:hypothetical protein
VSLIPLSLSAAPTVRFAGQLGGLVTDSSGKPQAGALVMLFNRQEHVLQRVPTDLGGTFSFEDLLPDIYSIRVSFATFVPAIRDRVQVKPGMRSLLEINLSRVFSTVQVVSSVPAPGGLMNDDWKWTLRSNASMRPVLRMFPALGNSASPAGDSSSKTGIFSDSRGMVRISASDGAQYTGDVGEADLGTQFAFATSIYGGNRVQVSGNVGYGAVTGTPATALRTTFSREVGGTTPTLSVTMRQLFVPLHGAQPGAGNGIDSPSLRTLSLSYSDKSELTDSLTAEYGFAMDSVSFIDRLHYLSPYARLNYAVGKGKVFVTWTSGNARPELGVSSDDQNSELRRDLTALSVLPRVTLENERARVQRGDDYEIGVTQKFGSREFRLSAYNERVSNTALTIANPAGGLFPGDLVPDLFSNSAVFNAGSFDSSGYMASVIQDLGENYRVSVTYGTVGMLTARQNGAISSADELRRAIEAGSRPAVTLRASGTVPGMHTRFVTSYQWCNYGSSMPIPQYSTDATRPEPGLNLLVRQPLPTHGMPWRMEASAEVRNLLAQGYMPVTMANGQQLVLVNTPRTFRGGLAFVF